MRTTEVPAAELRKAKNQLLAAHYRQLQTGAGLADLLGTYEVFYGSYTRLFDVPKELDAVTAADVKHVAAKYLTEKNRTVATLVPEKPKPASPEVHQ